MFPRDQDSGVLEVDCRPLSRSKVMAELDFCMRHDLTFLGQDRDYWRDLLDRPDRLLEFAQQLADEADPDEYDMWGVRYLE